MSRQSEIDNLAKLLIRYVTAPVMPHHQIAEFIVDSGVGTKDRFTWKYPKIDTSVGYYDGKNCLTIQPIDYKENHENQG